MKKIIILSAIFFAVNSYSYEKIDFVGQISDSYLADAIAVVKKKDKLYILSPNLISVYDSSFTLAGKLNVKIPKPSAFTISDDKIYVLDSASSIVSAYDETGNFLFSFGSKGNKNGQLSNPADLKYFEDGKIYVANTSVGRVEVFDKNGVYLYGFATLKKDGSQVRPQSISFGLKGFIYLCDPNKSVIQKYDRLGRLILEKDYYANSIAVSDRGIVYIAADKEGKIKELDRDLNPISTFGTKGKAKFEFLSFPDMETDEDGNIFILDSKNKKAMVLELENNKYEKDVLEYELLDLVRLSPDVSHKVSAFSFAPIEEGLVYYDEKARKGYLLEGENKKEFFSYGDGDGFAKEPADMAFAGSKIYVCDTGNSRTSIFSKDGKYDSFFGGKTGFLEKSKEGKFNSPLAVTVDSKGKVYVADTGNSMVQAFNKDGIFLFTIGPDIAGANVKLVKIVDVKTDEENNLYILDKELRKVIVTDSNGKYLNQWILTDMESPKSFDYDFKGYLYFLDGAKSNISVFDLKGNKIGSFFSEGQGDRELNEPASVKIAKGKIFISDPLNKKIASYKISYVPSKPAQVSLKAGDESVAVSWSAGNPSVIEKFEIYRGENKKEMKKIDSVKTASYTDKNLNGQTTYYYRVDSVYKDEINPGYYNLVYFKGKEKIIDAAKIETEEDLRNKPPVEIIPAELNYVFSANYKYYIENPVGRVLIKNNTEEKFSNVKVTFFLKDYMDFPSDMTLVELLPRTSAYVDLKATLNNRILTINEDTPVQAQITASYYREGKENEIKSNKPIKILSKNAITWDNTERIANFITVKDTPVYALSRAMLNQKSRFEKRKDIDDNLLSAVIIWQSLSDLPVAYIPDPSNPYASVKSSADFITDTVQFPRNTLKLKSGDCDDLTVLFSTLLEAVGARVLILDYPGHIALMFEAQAQEISQVGLPDEMIVKYENKYFIPIETTMIGKGFYESVKYAAQMYKNSQDSVNVVDLRKAMSKFEPVTLPEMTEEFALSPEKSFEAIDKELDKLSQEKFVFYEKLYKQGIKASPEDLSGYINLGILYSGYSKLDEAEKVFQSILEKEDYNSAALNNLGNVQYLKKNYAKAAEYYEKASKLDSFDENIFLNLGRAYIKLGKRQEALIYLERAVKINPSVNSLAESISK